MRDCFTGPRACLRSMLPRAAVLLCVAMPVIVYGLASSGRKAPDEYSESDARSEETPFEDVGTMLCEYFPVMHLTHNRVGPEISAKAWTNYLDSVDSQRLYFLQSDIDEFEKYRLRLGEMFAAGDLSFGELVFDRLRERVADRAEFIAGLFGVDIKEFSQKQKEEKKDGKKASDGGDGESSEEVAAAPLPFDFFDGETFDWDRKDSGWPADAAERDDLWRRRVKNAYLMALVNSALDKEEDAAEAEKESDSGDVPGESEHAGGAPAAESPAASPEVSIKAENTEALRNKTVDDILKDHLQYMEILNDSDREYYMGLFLNAFTMAFDPHSSYMSPTRLEDFSIDMKLSLQGIGATLRSDRGAARVVEIIPGSPAERDMSETRLVPGDRIVAVAQGDDGEFVDIMHWPLYKAVRLIRGEKGSVVRLKVEASSDASGNTVKTVRLVRDEIKLEERAADSEVKEVTDSQGGKHKFGYVNVPSFYSGATGGDQDSSRTVTDDVRKMLAELNAEGVEGLVLDLRGNGGGSLSEAISLSGLFIRSGPVVLVRERSRILALRDLDSAVAFTKPLVVLVDRLSASASEIVAGALQDYGRAVIVGDSHTHGKGTVQTVLPLGEERFGSMKITTASFYRVTGSSTQIRGVSADIHIPSIFESYPELGEDKMPNAVPWSSVRGVYFTRVADLNPAVAFAESNTVKRLASDEKWKDRIRLMERMSFSNTNTVVSLDYGKRLAYERESREVADAAMHESEKAFIDAEESEKDSEAAEEKEAAKTPEEREREREDRKRLARDTDIVIREAYNILLDLIEFEKMGGQVGSVVPVRDFFSEFFN